MLKFKEITRERKIIKNWWKPEKLLALFLGPIHHCGVGI
jgi:hypothetical protein